MADLAGDMKQQTGLSIRGGGIRGIVPACCLVKLEQQLGGLTRDHIDYCAGTSTGALLAAGIAAGVPAKQLLKVYTERSREIFTPSGILADAKRIAKGFMYDPANLRRVLVETFFPESKMTLNDSPLRLMITATAMNGRNWYFVQDNPKNARTTGKVSLVDAAVASSCAPTYFEDSIITLPSGKPLAFFDGGCGGTANPVYQACVEAFEYDTFDPQNTRVISLGTGFYPGSDAVPKGLLAGIGWVTSTLIDSSEDWADEAVNRHWPGLLQTFNPELPSSIDEADTSAIPQLVKIGEKMADSMDWRKILA